MPDVIAIGETMVLFAPLGDGPLRYVHHFEKRIAGAESNVLIGLARLGHQTGWISRLGADEFGHFVLNTIRGEGVDVSRVRFCDTAPTAVYFKERRSLGTGQVYYYRKGSAASTMTPDDLDVDYIQSARILLGSGITPALSESCKMTLSTAVDLAREAGIAFVFDPNVRLKLWPEDEARATLLSFVERATIVLPGQEEAEFLTGEQDPVRSGRILKNMGPDMVVMKLGARGALVITDEDEIEVPGFPVSRVVDPIGAGDAFAAGLIAGLLEGLPPHEAAHIGNACGAFAVTVPGDVEGLPSRDEIDKLMHQAQGGPDVIR